MKKVVIVSAGAIARHLSTRLESMGISVCFYLRKDLTLISFEAFLAREKPQAVFICISTRDKGEAARDFILACVKAGIPVISCEKGSFAYHAEVLKPHLKQIGFSATVTGGTIALRYVQYRRPIGGHIKINAVLNGTLNFIFDEMRRGRTLGEACKEASRLGYAEPGASDPLSLINGELKDVLMKVCVFFNTTLANKKFITPDLFGRFELNPDDLENLSEVGGNHRLVVSFSNHPKPQVLPTFGKEFGLHGHDGWHITGGFRQINNTSHLYSWLPSGVGNAVNIVEGELGLGGEYTLSGPGAGHEPTTSAMLADFAELCL